MIFSFVRSKQKWSKKCRNCCRIFSVVLSCLKFRNFHFSFTFSSILFPKNFGLEKKRSNIFDQKIYILSNSKNSKCGEIRSKKFFQIPKKLIKTHPVMYFSSQTDEMSMRTTRITDLFNIQEGSKSPSGGNQVDGLPPASSIEQRN